MEWYFVKHRNNFTYIHVKVKGKVKLSLCFFVTEHHAIKAYWGAEV
jgi:hypothetical protein